jgi:hypothetical protein
MIRHNLLDFDILGANKSDFTRDEFVQFLGVAVSGEQGKCVWGEVFAGSLEPVKIKA